MQVSPRRITALVDALEADGLVARRPHESDRRSTVIELTEAGRERCEEHVAVHRDDAAGVFDRLSSQERSDLMRLLARLDEVIHVGAGAT